MLILKSIILGCPAQPTYVRILVRIKQEPKYNLRSSAELLLTPPPAKTFGDRAFQVVASTLWNKLPANIRAITNILFQRAYAGCRSKQIKFDITVSLKIL